MFAAYSRRYVGRHFHALRLSRSGFPTVDPSAPLVVYVNHASWWDPLSCLLLTQELFPSRAAYAPIESVQLERYGVFRGLGFFGADPGSPRGGRRFLRTAGTILAGDSTVLWLTPQGRFCDVRQRPVELLPGLAHLASRHPDAQFLPLALEYPFWKDRLPEILVRAGRVRLGGEIARGGDIRAMSGRLSSDLEEVQDALAVEARSQDPGAFREVCGGRSGVGGVYDAWRRFRAWCEGRKFVADHAGGMP